MNTPSMAELNQAFAIQNGNDSVVFESGQGDIPVVKMQNSRGRVLLGLQGAHLLSWIPTGQDDVIWVSEAAVFSRGKAVRGGIPVCWPWFGAHGDNVDFPAHGFARTAMWQVTGSRAVSEAETFIDLSLDTIRLDENCRSMWPWPTEVIYRVTLSDVLTLQLTTTNNSDQDISLSQALHTYFNIGAIGNTTVLGLEGKDYLDKTEGFKRKTQTGSIKVETEVDRVYLDTPDDVVIDNNKRKITIQKQGSRSTVVWNPWKQTAEKMADMSNDGYLEMLCVESTNAADDCVQIPAGESHTLSVIYRVA